MAPRQPFTLGVNYWPRRKAMYWWSSFDEAEVREEFGIIKDLNLDVVRIFLLWDDFQPTPDTVSPQCLKSLTRVADIAAEYGLGLNVTFFTGHMSGPNWSPQWLLGGPVAPPNRQIISRRKIVQGGYRNPYTDKTGLEAAQLLVQTVVGELHDHPGIWLWNLGNEPDLFAWPPDAETGRAWVKEMTDLIHNLDPEHPVTCGLHNANLLQDNGLRIDQVFAETDVAVMHNYSIYSTIAREPLDRELVPFTCALTRALCGKPVLMEEFGGCTAPPGSPSFEWEWEFFGSTRRQFMMSEEDLAAFVEATLPRLIEVGATGAIIWCYADYVPELWHLPPCGLYKHERFFGLVRPDGSLKPHAEVLRDFAARKPKLLKRPKRRVKLDITPDEYYSDPVHHAARLYEQYLSD